MLASWISQASFDPPGLTVAVARDRAVEDLTHKGDRFVVNILAEGRSLGLMKHFLKPFGPGEDRFEGVAQLEAVEASAPVLADSLAWLQCRVSDRMECGDHWLVYATIEEGGLLDGDGRTAIHHRTNGRFY
jgi:flavin reductase (DIM6/NTAB) family NADH-FMN oxidoreductase RutF